MVQIIRNKEGSKKYELVREMKLHPDLCFALPAVHLVRLTLEGDNIESV